MGERGVNASLPQARLLCRPAVICRGGSAATGRLRFWELLGIFGDFLREARRFSARFWLRLSAQQHPHLNRTRKSQLTLSNTSVTLSNTSVTLSNTSVALSNTRLPSAIPQRPQQYLSALSNTRQPSAHLRKHLKISQNIPRSPKISHSVFPQFFLALVRILIIFSLTPPSLKNLFSKAAICRVSKYCA